MQKQTFKIEGYEILTKPVLPAGSSGRIFVPKKWVGKKVSIILTEPLTD